MSAPELVSARRLGFSCNTYGISDPLTVINRLFTGFFCRDRFDRLNKYSPFRVKNGMDSDAALFMRTKDEPVADIKQLMDDKARPLVRSGEELYVSWSGGVDSTAALIALMRAGAPVDQINVICAPFSKVEYPKFYTYLKDKGYRILETPTIVDLYNVVIEGKIITGWCADQLFGSNIHLRNFSWYSMPWIDGLKEAMTNRGIRLSDKSYERLYEVYSSYADFFGVKLEFFCEFAWLINFGIKWSYVADETFLAVADAGVREKIVPFYAGVNFQRWSYQQFDSLHEYNAYDNPKLYKRPLKEYIYEFTNDDDYFRVKGKKNSWALVIDDTNSVISVHDTEAYRKFKLKTAYSDRCALNAYVGKKYLKEENLD